MQSILVLESKANGRVDYITGTYGFDEAGVRVALHKKGGKVAESINLLEG